jgi:hypothetical protein
MFGAITALLNSEKALAGGALAICATILTALGYMTTEQWTSYTQWIFGLYVGGKTATSAVAMLTKTPDPAIKPGVVITPAVPPAAPSGV